MTEKVIEFPKHKVVRDVPDEVFEERNRKADQKVADAMVEEMTGLLPQKKSLTTRWTSDIIPISS